VGVQAAFDVVDILDAPAGEQLNVAKKKAVSWGATLGGAWAGMKVGAKSGVWGAALGGLIGGFAGATGADWYDPEIGLTENVLRKCFNQCSLYEYDWLGQPHRRTK
jgi:hypothetical protein